MTNLDKISPAPWTVTSGQVIDANGEVLASLTLHDNESDLANGKLMAAAPELLESLLRCEELIKINITTLTSILRHEIHAADLMISLSDLTGRFSEHLKEIEKLTDHFRAEGH